jgi:mono/diheme cytochrome c family protein
MDVTMRKAMIEATALPRLLFATLLAAALFSTFPHAAAQESNTGSKNSAASPNADNGRKLFLSDGCYECHGREAQGGAAGPRLGPDPLPLAAILKYVRHPAGQMPPYTSQVISDSQLADIHAFLESLPKPPKPDSIPGLR